MPGIRIRHHTRKNQVLLVPFLHKPWTPRICGNCKMMHPCKTWHANLDATGSVIVTQPLIDDLKKVPSTTPGFPLGGFRIENEVKKPPTQGIGAPTKHVKFEGVEVGGKMAEVRGRPQISTTAGITNPNSQPEVRIAEKEEFFRIVERLGISREKATDFLLSAVLNGHIKTGE